MDSGLDDLLDVLGRERNVLEILLFRLFEARALLELGEHRFLHLAARDLEAAGEAVREVELRRALLPDIEVGGGTLRELADASPPPLDGILRDHLVSLSRLAAEVGAATEATSELAQAGLDHLERAATVDGGRRSPGPAWPQRPPAALDELDQHIVATGYEAVLVASERLALPSFVAFLG